MGQKHHQVEHEGTADYEADSIRVCGCKLDPPPPTSSQGAASSAQGGDAPESQSHDLNPLIGVGTAYYNRVFSRMKPGKWKPSWNWCAFLFAPFWLVYRKMYSYGLAFMGVTLVFSLLRSQFISQLSLCLYILCGVFGNALYKVHLEQKAAQAELLTGTYQSDFYKKNGGINKLATVLSIGAFLVLAFLFSYI